MKAQGAIRKTRMRVYGTCRLHVTTKKREGTANNRGNTTRTRAVCVNATRNGKVRGGTYAKGTREHEPSARDIFTGEYEGKPKIYQLVRELNARTQRKPMKEHSHTLV